jgi:hypothetical protein
MSAWRIFVAAFVFGVSVAIASEVVERAAAHYWGPKRA